jgi:hypothetical protein
MSHFCQTHPRYEAKREPNSTCGDCWQLYHYKNPELKDKPTARLFLQSEVRKPKGNAATEQNE